MAVKVADASAIAAILFNETGADGIVTELEGATLAAPSLIEYELGNTCWKKCRRHPELAASIRKALGVLPDLDLRLHDVDVHAVLAHAERHDISFYDASYLWLAHELQVPLVSLDKRMQALAPYQ